MRVRCAQGPPIPKGQVLIGGWVMEKNTDFVVGKIYQILPLWGCLYMSVSPRNNLHGAWSQVLLLTRTAL